MNKRLLAITIAASLAAPLTVMAEGAEIYGIAHAAFMNNSVDDGDAATTNDQDDWTLASYNSRLGFKGSEDLGGGLKAVYKMEFGVDIVSGGGFSGRNQYVGLSGGMGTVLLGRHDTPTKMVQGKFDVFNDTIADMVNGAAGVTEADLGYDMNGDGDTGDAVTLGGVDGDVRADNVIAYLSPKMGGMQMIVALIPGESNVSGSQFSGINSCDSIVGYNNVCDGLADGTSISFTYEAGPLYVGVGMDGGDLIQDQQRLVATYAMDAMQFGFLYNVSDAPITNNPAVDDETSTGLSFSMGMGDNAVKFQYVMIDNDLGVKDLDTTKMTLGYDMNMSARTKVYALYNTGTTESPGNPDMSLDNFGVGIQHSF